MYKSMLGASDFRKDGEKLLDYNPTRRKLLKDFKTLGAIFKSDFLKSVVNQAANYLTNVHVNDPVFSI